MGDERNKLPEKEEKKKDNKEENKKESKEEDKIDDIDKVDEEKFLLHSIPVPPLMEEDEDEEDDNSTEANKEKKWENANGKELEIHENDTNNLKSRRTGTTVPPVMNMHRGRKISFADDVEQRSFQVNGEPHNKDITEDVDNEGDETDVTDRLTVPVGGKEEAEEAKDKFRMKQRESRFSTISRFSMGSRPSFAGLTSRASMASLKSTISRVNSELYPERGSFVAHSLGQSFAELPQALARKVYILTQILAAVSVSIGSMAVGFNAAYTSPALASMSAQNSTFNLTDEQESWVGSLMPLNALIGSIIGGYLIDALGRKMLILICGPPLFAAMIIIGSAANVWMLYVGRSIVGLCVGFLTLTLPVYLGETIQPEIRGTLGLLPTTIGNIGILMCFLVGSYVNWSWLAYIGALIPLLFFSMMIFVPETPRWYVSKGQDDHAERSLQWLRGTDNDVEFELEAIQDNFAISAAQSSSFRDLFKREYIRPLAISIGLMLVQQLSGINAVIFYTVDIFNLSGSDIDDNLSTIIVGIVNFLSTFIANILIDKLGRKILLYISSVAMVISLFALGTYFYIQHLSDPGDVTNNWNDTVSLLSWLPLVSFMIYVIAFSLGWGPIPWLFMGEALPAQIRGPAASLVTALNWSCTFVVTKTFPGMVKKMGAYGVFYMFGVVMVVGSIFSVFCVPETKGKTLEEIEAQLSGRAPTTSSEKEARHRRYSEMSGIVIK